MDSSLRLLPQQKSRTYSALIVESDLTQIGFWSSVIKKISGDFTLEYVSTAEDAVRAISRLQSEGKRFDLVISEIFLRGRGSGLDLWKSYEQEAKHFFLTSKFPKTSLDSLLRDELKRPHFLPKPLETWECVETLSHRISA
jgi:response regulator of citrate/malate metabolism